MNARDFFLELRRRRVWRVAGAYVLVAWMAVEIVLETAPILGIPDGVSRAVVVVGFLGFPVTLVLAWVFDITAHGIVRTPSLHGDDPAEPAASLPTALPGDRARLAGVFGAGVIVALVGFGAYAAIQPTPRIRPELIESIAVLPLADLSPGSDQRYFADGITEELINRLARIPELRVVGRASSFALRDEGAGLKEIARRLRVDAVIEGSVRRSGDRLRVSVELVDARSGFQLWSETYDRGADDIFTIQDEISAAMVAALRVQLAPGASRHRAGTESVRAHDSYLLGLNRWHARTEVDLLEALDYFASAIEEDPSYAPARAGLALTYAVLPWYSDIPSDLAADRGLEGAARALALDAQNAEAHAAIGQIAQAIEWNLPMAETAYRRAIAAQPGYATAHQWYAETLLLMGRLEEAGLASDRAVSLDPLSIAGRYIQGMVHLARRDLDAARDAFHRIARDHPGFIMAQQALIEVCLVTDCHDLAESVATTAYGPSAEAAVRAVIRADRAATGDRGAHRDREAATAAALAALQSLRGEVEPARVALLHAALDDREGAIRYVQQSYAEGADPALPFALVHPLFDTIRNDPRFNEISRAIGVEAPMARRGS